MLLVIWQTFWAEEKEKLTRCSEFTHGLLGAYRTKHIFLEDEKDPESCMDLALRYDDLGHSGVAKWQELADFARLHELYVIVYEQGSSNEKGYWYDEADEWISRNFGPQERYENILR